MIKIWRRNAFADIQAPPEFFQRIYYHLAVPIEPGTKMGRRFGGGFERHGQKWGSLLHGNRVAAGLVRHVRALADHYGYKHEYFDIRERPADQYPMFMLGGVKWREYQEQVFKRCIQKGSGVIDAPPRSGKTLMAARGVDRLAVPTVYLAPSLPIVKQTYKVFCDIWTDQYVARLDGAAKASEKDISKPIVVATAASAVKQPQEWWDTRQHLVIDEFHHAAAETYHRINEKAANIFYRFAYTGTHFRTGDDELAMEAIASDVLYKIPVRYLVRNNWLASPRVHFMRTMGNSSSTSKWASLYRKCIVLSEERNQKVIDLARYLGHTALVPTIVLTRRREHADLLGEAIPGAAVVKGGENALTSKTVQRFRDGEIPVLVGTSVIGEGVDLPNAGALVYASAGGEGVQMMQSYFRPLTAQPGKETGYIYDFRDVFQAKMHEHSIRRFEFARDMLGADLVTME